LREREGARLGPAPSGCDSLSIPYHIPFVEALGNVLAILTRGAQWLVASFFHLSFRSVDTFGPAHQRGAALPTNKRPLADPRIDPADSFTYRSTRY